MALGLETMPVVAVVYENVEGYHRFTSPQVPGLFVIVEPADYKVGLDDVPAALGMLIESDTGGKVSVRQIETFSEYTDRMPDDAKPTIFHFVVESAST
jgi:hypothetical protein